MQFNVQEEFKNLSGIYRINVEGGSGVYIGSAINLRKRYSAHFSQLRKQTHHCQHLQNAFNKYGVEAFSFEVLEFCDMDKTILLAREQHWLDNTERKYNICLIAGNTLGTKRSEEYCIKLADKFRGKPKNNNTSGYANVFFKASTGRWSAAIKYRGKTFNLGCYDTVELANDAYKRFLANPDKFERPKLLVTNSSGFNGVSWHKTKRVWEAHIKINTKKIHLGSFKTAEDAHQARLKFEEERKCQE